MHLRNSWQVVLPENNQSGGFGLYIHWPFCQSKCPYCDFNSHVSASIDQSRWLASYINEIKHLGRETPSRILDTVFFGGGTPSLMRPEIVAGIMETIRATWRVSNSFEVTLEANPTSVEAGRFQGYRDAGVNRVSIGIQALNDNDLHALGRLHSVSEARKALDTAHHIFDRVSFDLIYARQGQTLADWQAELTQAVQMASGHISLYQLTIEEGTAFGDRYARGKLPGLPPDDDAADMYFETQDICAAAGLPAYEISNHASPGNESRHNLIYWNYADYGGIGPGAHGRLSLNGSRYATETYIQPGKWLEQVENHGKGESLRNKLSSGDQGAEYLMMGLRIDQGISLSRYQSLTGDRIKSTIINDLTDIGVVRVAGDRLAATPKGRPVLNSIIRELLPDPT